MYVSVAPLPPSLPPSPPPPLKQSQVRLKGWFTSARLVRMRSLTPTPFPPKSTFPNPPRPVSTSGTHANPAVPSDSRPASKGGHGTGLRLMARPEQLSTDSSRHLTTNQPTLALPAPFGWRVGLWIVSSPYLWKSSSVDARLFAHIVCLPLSALASLVTPEATT
jgi:hypothetical protein